VDAVAKRIIGDMTFASADEPYRVFFAGSDVSDEATTSPVDVGAIVFEDAGGVRAFLCNAQDKIRHVSLEFRGRTEHRTMAAGELAEIVLLGAPSLVDAMLVALAEPATAAV
jgi:hypothetical protein